MSNHGGRRQITRRQAITQMAALGTIPLAYSVLGRAIAGQVARRPNILFIMADDHAQQAISAYGSRINATPNIDRIAREGIRFDNCFCTNSLCGPSRAVILTGKYSHLNGVMDNGRGTVFDGSQPTFPKMLQKAGYQTALIGKWHLTSEPTGFDYWNILPGQGVYVDPQFIKMGRRQKVKGYVTDIITDDAIACLKDRDRSKPFCLMVHHKAPHRQWVPDEKHAALYEDTTIPEPETFDDDYANRATPAGHTEMTIERNLNKADLKQDPPPGLAGEKLKEWKYQRFIKDYLRVVASVDDNVGRLLDALDREDLANDTIVIYTADNGFFLGEHGWFDKRFMYEESLHIPLLVRWPGHTRGGSVCRQIVSNVDFAETFLDCAGVPLPADMQGRSLRPLLESRSPADWRKVFYYHYYEFPQPHHVYPHYGVRTDRYKLIYYYTLGEWELFDLAKDGSELKSVYGDPAYATVRGELTAELARLRRQLNDRTPATRTSSTASQPV